MVRVVLYTQQHTKVYSRNFGKTEEIKKHALDVHVGDIMIKQFALTILSK